MEFLARRYDTAEVVRVSIQVGRIDRVARTHPAAHSSGIPYVGPGFVDIQVNGLNGQEFSSQQLTADKVTQIVRAHWRFGVTGLCPTLTTQSQECLAHGMAAIDQACREHEDVKRAVVGIHLEGPYFSKEDGPRGAHPKEHCRAPNWDEFSQLQKCAGGRIRLLTMSPEFDNAPDFIARAVRSNVVVAIGHTGASGDQIQAAVESGARLSTHLGNGAHRMLRRHPNYLWDQMAEDRLVASLIIDGHHLPPEVVKTMVRAKTAARCVIVSDVSGLAGLPPGRYASSGGDVEILADGRLVIAGQDQLLAGASLPIGVGVQNVIKFAGVDLKTAVAMASTQPAALIDCRVGGLLPGDAADLTLFHYDSSPSGSLSIQATISAGNLVYGAIPA